MIIRKLGLTSLVDRVIIKYAEIGISVDISTKNKWEVCKYSGESFLLKEEVKNYCFTIGDSDELELQCEVVIIPETTYEIQKLRYCRWFMNQDKETVIFLSVNDKNHFNYN